MKDVEILRQSIRAVTQILTESDVKVTQQGMDAYTTCDNRTGKITHINLPYLPDDAPDSLIQAVQGYLDHEVGHALFTDFEVTRSVTDDCTKQLHNIVEDAFVERKMSEKFRGSAYNLGNVSEFFRTKHLDKVVATGNVDEIKKSLIVAAIRAFSGQDSYMTYMADKWHHIEDFKKKIEPLTAMLSSTKNSTDCKNAAIAIKKAIFDDEPEMPPSNAKPDAEDEHEDDDKSNKTNQKQPEEANDEEGDGDDDSESGSESESDDEESSPETSSDEDELDEGDDSEDDEDEGQQSEESKEDEDEVDSDSDNDDESKEDAAPSEGSADDSSASDEGSEGEADDSEGEADESDFVPPPSMADLITEGLNGEFGSSLATEVAETAKSSDYLIYTDEYDQLGLYEDIKFGSLASDNQVEAFESKVNHMMSPIQKDIERAICARSASTHTGGFRSGKLHSSALSRLMTNDDRVFRRKQVNTTKDVAVSLVMDCSGSMSGSKIMLAAYSAYTLSTVLDRLGITHEVIGFTTARPDNGVYEKMREECNNHGINYARYENTVMPVFKAYNEKMSMKVKRRLANVEDGNLGSNVDGECIAIAAKRLMAQKEKGKIMIVLSDGMPAVWGDADLNIHLKQTVKQIEAAGVNVVGIGIQSKAVEKFYSKHIHVTDVSELPTVVGRQLKAMLLGASR